ncbi:recombination-associated protein RdgC [Variovorax sp. J22R24]|uniref:recombination-associated protein RdgC n=1 Tax=Variovorax gracilis TaxID=3053502 RepID=UPI002578797B|nr:recombination-associated protein RdgC [Variovorax sp. J22R24]MDM0107303.1 recombination-associated protein RdgC [Variovorax sp. J22R24]
MSVFKNVIVYRIEATWSQSLDQVEQGLGTQRFVPCSPSQEKSAGWVEPRGQEHGPLAESIGGQWLLEFMVETKALPASVVRRKVEERAAQIEATTGRKPGKKEKKELKEDITLELLPLAFTRHARVAVWIDPAARRLVVNSSNAARADEVVTNLVKALDGFAVSLVNTQIEPAVAMSEWLSSQEPPAGFTIDRECELKASDESKAVVRYAKHPLDIEEVRQHIADGKRPTRLAMTWDDRVSFELTEGLQIRKIVFLEGTLDDAPASSSGGKEDNFDADAAIATGELGQLVPELLEALGGEMRLGTASADAAPAATAGAQAKANAEEALADESAPF